MGKIVCSREQKKCWQRRLTFNVYLEHSPRRIKRKRKRKRTLLTPLLFESYIFKHQCFNFLFLSPSPPPINQLIARRNLEMTNRRHHRQLYRIDKSIYR